MLTQIKKLLQRVFSQTTNCTSELEQFIISKRPTSTAEIEHWTRIWDQRKGGFYGR